MEYDVDSHVPEHSETSSVSSLQWRFQEPKLEVPTIYKAYIRPM